MTSPSQPNAEPQPERELTAAEVVALLSSLQSSLRRPRLMHSVNETAEILGVCRQTVYNYLRDGRLVAFKPGGRPGSRLLISDESIQAMLDASKVA
jgi:excisionase family DNA binding protein